MSMEWISVIDRLPSKYGYYLTYNDTSVCISKQARMSIYRFSDKTKTFYEPSAGANPPLTHWMPLPEAPHD